MKHRTINLLIVVAAFFALLAALAEPANAQGAGGGGKRQGPKLRVACGQDMQKLCPGMERKDARKCLNSHRAQLSSGCSEFFKEARERRKERKAGGGQPPGGGPPPGENPPDGGEPGAGAPAPGGR
jgi:hypothetical protein